MARLVAVNVGLPKDVQWRGQTVHTGVWKRPVTGPRMVRRLNIDGDGQGDLGGHGGENRAVLVYQLASYRHWQEQLGRDDFEHGQFGENFTVDGLPDDEVCIGDRYRIGDALFEVTQPRVTCYRVGLRMNEPRLPALMVSHRRPGFYLRVLTEGEVTPGDEIVKAAGGPEQMSVADIDALLYLPGHNRADLVKALRIPALSPGWRGSFQTLLDQGNGDGGNGNPGLSAAGAPPPAWGGFRTLRVAGVERESSSVLSLSLATLDGTALPAALPGQFVTIRLPDSKIIRTYSLSGPPGDPEYRISVKHEPGGAASGYLHTRVQPGDRLDVAAPRGTFALRDGEAPVVLLSAGVGATPVLAMLHALATRQPEREVWWLYGARHGGEHPFARESRELLARLPNAHVHICYSRPGPTDQLGSDHTGVGRLSGTLLTDLGVPSSAEAYICGPADFMREAPEWIAEAGIDPARVHTEIFGASPSLTPGIASTADQVPHAPPGPPGQGPAVTFARSGLAVNWDSRYPSLLELAEACSVPVRWSCRTGVCHNCETGMMTGKVDYSPAPVEPPAAGNTLVCCAQPLSEVILDL